MVDLFLEPPMPFAQLWSRAVTMNLRGVPIRVAAIDDLIALAMDSGALPKRVPDQLGGARPASE
jgi:hypothetical protein